MVFISKTQKSLALWSNMEVSRWQFQPSVQPIFSITISSSSGKAQKSLALLWPADHTGPKGSSQTSTQNPNTPYDLRIAGPNQKQKPWIELKFLRIRVTIAHTCFRHARPYFLRSPPSSPPFPWHAWGQVGLMDGKETIFWFHIHCHRSSDPYRVRA